MTGQEIVALITAERALAAQDQDPDKYRQEHGRCPRGYQHDPETDTCVKISESPQEPPGDAQPEPDTKETQDTDTPRDEPPGDDEGSRDTRTFKEKGFDRYRAKIDKLRKEGKLPDEKLSRLLVQIDDPDELPEEIRKDPAKLREVIKNQEALRVHQDQILRKKISNIKKFEKRVKEAEERGERPPKFSVLEMLRGIEEFQGAPVEVPEPAVEQLQDAINRAAVRPGTRTFKLREWLDSWVRLPRWRSGASAMAVAEAERAARRDLSWPLGFPPYDQERVPRRHIPQDSSGRPGFPPYGDDGAPPDWRADDTPDAVVGPGLFEPGAKMRGFPPYTTNAPDKAPGVPRHMDNIGLPPYNKPEPRRFSYLKPESEHAPGFPPYNRVPRYEALRDHEDTNPRDA